MLRYPWIKMYAGLGLGGILGGFIGHLIVPEMPGARGPIILLIATVFALGGAMALVGPK